MKKYLLGAAAILAMAAPGFAHADDTGSMGVHYNNFSGSGSGDLDVYGLDLSYQHALDGGLSIQGDASSDRLDFSGAHFGVSNVSVSLGTRSDTSSFYGYLGHTDLFYLGDAFDVGVGGALYGSNFTVNGDIGYADFQVASITNADVNGDWFFSDNFAVTGQLGYVDIDGGGNAMIYGIGADWRFTGSPAALSVGYERLDSDFADIDVWKIGLRWQFGTDSLRQASQTNWNGATRQYQDHLDAIF